MSLNRIHASQEAEPSGPYMCDCGGEYVDGYGPDNCHHFACAILFNYPMRCPVQACRKPFKSAFVTCKVCGRMPCERCAKKGLCHGQVESIRLGLIDLEELVA